MATLSINSSGNTPEYNIQWYEGKHRRTISLGGRRYDQKTAEQLKDIVEKLMRYRDNGIDVLDKRTAAWLATASDHLRSKLEKSGLIAVPESKTCQELWDTFLKFRTDLKKSSVQMYHYCRKHFEKRFLPTEPIENITAERFIEWKIELLRNRCASASVGNYQKKVNTVLNWAVQQDWLAKNPLQGIPRENCINREKDQIISPEEYVKLLDACPTPEWRVIIALGRIGGLRCPSEPQQLRWADIDWASQRFLVRSSKTERYARHRKRFVPLFPELRTELEHLRSLPETEGNEFVIQITSWNLHPQIKTIAGKAGLTIVRPFDNMRMSRSNEIVRLFGETKENMWIGHSKKVMEAHYLRPMDEDFMEAAKVSLED